MWYQFVLQMLQKNDKNLQSKNIFCWIFIIENRENIFILLFQ